MKTNLFIQIINEKGESIMIYHTVIMIIKLLLQLIMQLLSFDVPAFGQCIYFELDGLCIFCVYYAEFINRVVTVKKKRAPKL